MEYNAGFEQDVLNDPSLLFKVDYQDDQVATFTKSISAADG